MINSFIKSLFYGVDILSYDNILNENRYAIVSAISYFSCINCIFNNFLY